MLLTSLRPWTAALSLLAAATLYAEVRLPAVISDHMLVQRDMPVRIWGKAAPSEQVTVRFRGQTAATQADALGRWAASLAPSAAGGPFELTVQGQNTLTVRDVLVGDVWVASGQSNMEWPLSRADNAEKEIAAARDGQIRFFRVAHKVSVTPLDDVEGSWTVCSPETAKEATAVGYFFARHLREKVKTPIGILQSAWGGTPAESWTSLRALAADPALLPVHTEWARTLEQYPIANLRYEQQVKAWEGENAASRSSGQAAKPRPAAPQGPGHAWTPSGLYNAMIAPITPYAIRGAIWYQGESNTGARRVGVYQDLFEAMIRDWRQAWGQGDFPFLFVQLANYSKIGADADWPALREAQRQTLALQNTGMAVTIDIGNPDDIHPTNKQDVGLRLALAARAVAYGERIVQAGPLARSVSREPDGMRVWFDHVGGGLQAKGGSLRGFEVAGADGRFVPAQARIDKQSLFVTNPTGTPAMAVRYAWDKNPEATLFNMEGLPASPFWLRGLQ